MSKERALIRTLPMAFTALMLSGCSGLPDMGAGVRALESGNVSQAKYHFKELAERGFPDAMVLLGDLYLKEGQYHFARNTYQSALDAGSQKAPVRLARLLYRKNTGGNSPEIAEVLLIKAMASDPKVVGDLARLYFEWPELISRREQQVWFSQAINAGFDEAWFYLAESLACSDCTLSQLRQAVEAYKKSAAVKPQAIKSLIALYQRHPELGSLETLAKELENLSLITGQVYFALANQSHFDTTNSQSPFIARDYYLKATDSYPKAWGRLFALALRNPEITSAEELDSWLLQAKNSGFIEADIWQARRLILGTHTIVDPFKAEKLLKGLAPVHKEAAYRLGELYLSGMLGEPDYMQGFKLLEHSGRQGVGAAYFKIAETLAQGIGIPKNPEKAMHFAKLALINGSDKAAAFLGQLENSNGNYDYSSNEHAINSRRLVKADK